jgi:hypothetical protein
MALVPLLLTAALAAPEPAAAGANALSRVSAVVEERAVVIGVAGSRPPTFTTFATTAPPRFVLEIADATVDELPGRMAIRDELVRSVEVAPARDGSPSARVTVALSRAVEPPGVETQGNDIRITFERPPLPPPSPALRLPPLQERAAAPATTGRADPREGRRVLRELGFEQGPEVSRVYVRLSGPPRFSVSEAGPNVLRVELPDTAVARPNDTRPLDARYFPGAVATVTPRRHRGGVALEIALKGKVSHREHVEGHTLAIDFDNLGR